MSPYFFSSNLTGIRTQLCDFKFPDAIHYTTLILYHKPFPGKHTRSPNKRYKEFEMYQLFLISKSLKFVTIESCLISQNKIILF